ncbi:GNAT family N-acetyltransferase [Mesorhizobium xinjiangense]|uniref:GNAT family N-acetyltransferase n=1 Tax=Mesorhizobium xinjiangense TaxID=2678685 RepID=UPI0012ED6AF6|nr:GNAT family N-acetyltransferase [Mesorhizobium xinjiangense]
MKLPFGTTRKREFAIEMLRPDHAPALARLHAGEFTRAWTDGEFSVLLEQEPVFGFAAREVGQPKGDPAGFVLARQAAGEAEILTITVARARRRQGLGWLLMDAVLRELHGQRAESLFLEVDETNLPACSLYRRLGFQEVGKRPGYYELAERGRSNALVMRRDLR